MRKTFFLSFFFCIASLSISWAQEFYSSDSTPMVPEVDVNAEQIDDPFFCSMSYEKYQEIWNSLKDESLHLFSEREMPIGLENKDDELDNLNRQLFSSNLFSLEASWMRIVEDLENVSDTDGIFGYLTHLMFSYFRHFQLTSQQMKEHWKKELEISDAFCDLLEKNAKFLVGSTYLLLGNQFEPTSIGCYGAGEASDKVRVTFINGILNTHEMMLQSLKLISESHGGVNVHYVFRPTEGWTWDISRAMMVKTAFALGIGFRSIHAHLLARIWRELIKEMGGVEGGGVIIHYAHSLGGSETERARDLLTLEEQKMIRVITFGSATIVRNVGFQNVLNMIGKKDGVGIFFDPIGHIRNFVNPDYHVRFLGSFFSPPYWPCLPLDHLLNGSTYGPVVLELGEQFFKEFILGNTANSIQ